MTETEQLVKFMVTLGWNQAELSRRLRVSRLTVHNWVHGKYRVPYVVLAYLALMAGFKEALEEK